MGCSRKDPPTEEIGRYDATTNQGIFGDSPLKDLFSGQGMCRNMKALETQFAFTQRYKIRKFIQNIKWQYLPSPSPDILYKFKAFFRQSLPPPSPDGGISSVGGVWIFFGTTQ